MTRLRLHRKDAVTTSDSYSSWQQPILLRSLFFFEHHGHLTVRDVIDDAKDLAKISPDEKMGNSGVDKIRRIADGLDLLIMAYAKAEKMTETPDEIYGALRSHWEIIADAYMRDHPNQPVDIWTSIASRRSVCFTAGRPLL